MKSGIARDPYNVIITGVGGQGNVMASRMLGNIMTRKGYCVTIGETFGVSQRGGSVMSHIRISRKSTWSPQIPRGQADIVVALEPIEAIRVMAAYGNERVRILCNIRPIYPVGVIAGELNYPAGDEIRSALGRLSPDVVFLNATDEAIKLGNPILGNVIMLGAVAGAGALPFDRNDFREVIATSVPADRVEINMLAFDTGNDLVKTAGRGLS
ncbi:MAG: indolepyruvate ferredoxin oxidoreductase [Spirochaetes bacterium RBG_13_51_14]|nr:MAG: indolepyruvate ferredoxin oxidoreductase [Spirochaetes bacterium RBG_13_51_14]